MGIISSRLLNTIYTSIKILTIVVKYQNDNIDKVFWLTFSLRQSIIITQVIITQNPIRYSILILVRKLDRLNQ